jgi:general secretion pathway protein D
LEPHREKEFALKYWSGTAVLLLAIGLTEMGGQALAHSRAVLEAGLLAAAIGQSPAEGGPANRQDVLALLQQARDFMRQGKLEQAEKSIAQAEQSGVSLGMFHLGDTPKKARRDLERLRAQRPKAPPSAAADPASSPRAPAAHKAVAGDPATKPAPSKSMGSVAAELEDRSPTGAASVASAQGLIDSRQEMEVITVPPIGEAITSLSGQDNQRRTNDRGGRGEQSTAPLLLEARRALAAGDVQTAETLIEQAEQAPTTSAPGGDSAAKVAVLIKKRQALAEALNQQGESEIVRRDLAHFTLEQAEGLLPWGDLDTAERLANQAQGLGVDFGPFEASPQSLLARIQQLRGERSHPLSQSASARLGDSAVRRVDYQEPVRLSDSARGQQGAPMDFDFPAEEETDSPFGEALPPVSQLPSAEPRRLGPGAKRPTRETAVENRAIFYLQQGEAALRAGDRNTATAYFQRARERQHELAEADRARLAQHLSLARKQQAEAALRLDGATAEGSQRGEARLTDDATPREREPGVSTEQAATRTPGPDAGQSLDPQRQQPVASEQPREAASATEPAPQTLPESLAPGQLLHEYSAGQRLLQRQLSAEVANQQSRAQQMKESDPRGALELLKQTRAMIEAAAVEPEVREQLLRRVGRTFDDVAAYFEAHRAEIELEDKNRATSDQVERERQLKIEIDEKLALLVDEYNKLMDEQRWAEAELVANKAIELAPKNPLAEQLRWNANFVRRYNQQRQTELDKESGFVDTLQSVNDSAIPFDDRNPISFGNRLDWEELTKRRRNLAAGDRPRRNEREMQIEQKLKTPISLQFHDAPLSQVLSHLADVAGINIHIDPEGLAAEGVTTDTPVTINLKQDISLKSALNLILEPRHLGYVIKDEVLKITSEQYRNGELIPVMYPVADLVIPIPNFVPGPHMGLAGSLHDAYTTLGYGGVNGFANQSPMAVVASKDGTPNSAMVNPTLLANLGSNSPSTMAGAMLGNNVPVGAGPGGAGGGVAADFDSLIQLITSTIAPTTWDEVGGSGSIEEFRTNLSLVISQTEDVHDQIRDLLEQLRRLQDLQVTIEVRFITLNDNFFERIGVDFDFNINDNTDRPFQVFGRPDPNIPTTYTAPPADGFFNNVPRTFNAVDLRKNQTTVVGLQAPDVFSADLDIPFRQNSFGLAVPQFGGFDPTAGASLGFAILSDIEAFFFINAAQGDSRTNVLQAPKVTLFNGQQATVSDTSQSPFVISVIPVVGDFAAAQQPVIVVLNEGTFMTVQATVSSDRRFVRLTIVPFFSHIGDVSTFTFEGSRTTRENSSSDGPSDQTTRRSQAAEVVTSGTTVQLPTFSFVTVTTTVSVPDGGTILLGGIKRLREGRNEFGVPILSKLPYINRLFKNVGIGRETQSLMMMVTPRIIIQEEEEQLLGITPTP